MIFIVFSERRIVQRNVPVVKVFFKLFVLRVHHATRFFAANQRMMRIIFICCARAKTRLGYDEPWHQRLRTWAYAQEKHHGIY